MALVKKCCYKLVFIPCSFFPDNIEDIIFQASSYSDALSRSLSFMKGLYNHFPFIEFVSLTLI